MASERAVERLGLTPMARIIGYAQAEVAPKWLFLAPIEGVRKLLAKTGMAIADFDLVEINEAFAAQVLADGRELGFDWSRVNVNGGAIALGHPIGASGARIVATLLHELRRRKGRYGLATLCLGRWRLRRDGRRAGLSFRGREIETSPGRASLTPHPGARDVSAAPDGAAARWVSASRRRPGRGSRRSGMRRMDVGVHHAGLDRSQDLRQVGRSGDALGSRPEDIGGHDRAGDRRCRRGRAGRLRSAAQVGDDAARRRPSGRDAGGRRSTAPPWRSL